MIGQAFAADAFPAAELVGAVAASEVLVTPALIHRRISFKAGLGLKRRAAQPAMS
jgi:hypothetical protein